MSAARDDILGRIRMALAGIQEVEVPRLYREAGSSSPDELVGLLARRVQEYRATVVVTDDARAGAAAALASHGARTVAIAPDLPAHLRPQGVELVVDEGLSPAELDAIDGVLTTCAAACAETGTVALDGGPGQGRRALSLVPDLHVCVVRAEDVVETVPELLARLEPSALEGKPIVLVSGPSATSDIELSRIEGVHGPRRFVLVVDVRSDDQSDNTS